MTLQIVFCIAIFLYMIVMLAWNKYPMGVTALTSMALLILFKCIGPANALSSFGNANAVIIVGMFVVGAGLRKTSLVTTITNFIRKVTGGSFKTAYCGIIVLAAILTSILTSPAVAYSIAFPIMDSICDEFKVSRSKVHFPLCITCLACCAVLPFGFAISQAAVFDGLMETYGFAQHFNAIDFTIGRLPIILFTLLWAFFYAPKVTPEKPILPIIGNSQKATDEPPPHQSSGYGGQFNFYPYYPCPDFQCTAGCSCMGHRTCWLYAECAVWCTFRSGGNSTDANGYRIHVRRCKYHGCCIGRNGCF